jgi:SAM-dependent methyltransferase
MEQYDALKARIYDQYFTGVAGDVPFYLEEALRIRGRSTVLELGCGTGRITFPLAEAGVRVVGMDNSAAMLNMARSKLDGLDAQTRRRIRLAEGDMRDFTLNQRFKLAIVPYRTFMHLLLPQDQVQALLNIRAHLTARGRLIFNIYDPSYELLYASAGTRSSTLTLDTSFTDPASGQRVVAWYSRRFDLAQQIIHQEMVFEHVDANGSVDAKYYSPLTLRYSHRYEMHYLLELCGYEVEALYGDFERGPYHGSEQIWIARKTKET